MKTLIIRSLPRQPSETAYSPPYILTVDGYNSFCRGSERNRYGRQTG